MRGVREADWSALRDVRLRALADSPDAFGSTLEREAAFNDADWQEWARDAAAGSAETCFLAWLDDEPVGIVAAYAEEGRDHLHLIAMWVAAEARRQGFGRALIEAIVSWSAESETPTIRLDVMLGNVEARRLYESFGFAPTGRTKQYEDRPHITTVELERLAAGRRNRKPRTGEGFRLSDVPKNSWLSPKVELRESPLHGRGTFAKEFIANGQVVEIWGEHWQGRRTVEYTDDRSAAEDAKKRGLAVMQWDTSLFSIENRGADDGYFLNHSCDSSLWLEDPFTLTARRDIQPDDELTIDYALFEADERLIVLSNCACRTASCRNTVTGRDWQLREVQERYARHFSPLINAKIAAQGLPQ